MISIALNPKFLTRKHLLKHIEANVTDLINAYVLENCLCSNRAEFGWLCHIIFKKNGVLVSKCCSVFCTDHKILFYFFNVSREVWVALRVLPGKAISWSLETWMGT